MILKLVKPHLISLEMMSISLVCTKHVRHCCFETGMIVGKKYDINETGQRQLYPSKGKKIGEHRHNTTPASG